MGKKKTGRAPRQVYAFVDTNIFLDFYRSGNESTLKMLERLKPVKEKVVCTYQVEMEFLKNRQRVLLESWSQLKSPAPPPMPAIFADSTASESLRELTEQVKKRADRLKGNIVNLLKNPKKYDVVYQVLCEIFQSPSRHVLTRDMAIRHQIKRLAFRRFILGYPPRKKDDTSIGDALNWEWVIHCASVCPGTMIIVSRDSDYGTVVDGEYFLNDALRQEVQDRVGPRKSVVYTQRLSDALKQLHVPVPQREVQAEADAIRKRRAFQLQSRPSPSGNLSELLRQLEAGGGE